jgi:endonuclease/exonuclease/phosphatase family metal-dependent hydrolase
MKLKFINLNLWLGGILFDEILEFLKEEKPDILAVQEAYNSKNLNLEKRFRSVDVLKNECSFKYNFFSPTCFAVLDDKKIEAGNAIFSNFPIIETNTIFFDVPFGEVLNYEIPGGDYSMTPRNIQHAVIKAENTNLNIFNTQGIWSPVGRDTERKLAMAEKIAEMVKRKEKTILAGDFNFNPDTESAMKIEEILIDVFKGKIWSTFNIRRKTNPVFANIIVDMIYNSKDLELIDSYCPDVDISDHLPLVCVFEI